MRRSLAVLALLLACSLLAATGCSKKPDVANAPVQGSDSWHPFDPAVTLHYNAFLTGETQTSGTVEVTFRREYFIDRECSVVSVRSAMPQFNLDDYFYEMEGDLFLLGHKVPAVASETPYYEPPIQFLRHRMEFNDSWKYTGVVGGCEAGNLTVTTHVLGISRVITPAGEFECICIEREGRVDGETETDTCWYARGVGLVKKVTDSFV